MVGFQAECTIPLTMQTAGTSLFGKVKQISASIVLREPDFGTFSANICRSEEIKPFWNATADFPGLVTSVNPGTCNAVLRNKRARLVF